MLLGAEIQEPDWVHIAEKLGFQLQSQTTSTAFFEGWCTFAQNVAPSWENLAKALEKMKVNKTKVGKIREKTGMGYLNDIVHAKMCSVTMLMRQHLTKVLLSSASIVVNSYFLFYSRISFFFPCRCGL